MDQINPLFFQEFVEQASNDASNFVGKDNIVISGNHALVRAWFELKRLFRPLMGVFIRVIRGEAMFEVNLITYKMRPGDILIFPENSVMEFISASEDLKIQFFSFSGLKDDYLQLQHHLHIDDDATWNRISKYISLLVEVSKLHMKETIPFIQQAIFSEIKTVTKSLKETNINKALSPHLRSVFDRFLNVVNENCERHRSIDFYARELCLSPNRLSSVIKLVSGRTVQQWIIQAVIQRAKILLIHSDMTIYQVSDRLYFDNPAAFTRYFKREIGMTPGAFRHHQ